MKWINLSAILVLYAIFANCRSVIAAELTTAPASTQPILAGRDTPAEAMNIFMTALEHDDLATVADSFNASERNRQSMAHRLINQQRLYRDLVAQFGKKEADRVFAVGYLRPWQPHRYVPEDWAYAPNNPSIALVNSNRDVPTGAYIPMMQQGPDGIWRQGRIFHPPPPRPDLTGMRQQMLAKMIQRDMDERNRFESAIQNLEAKKYSTTAQVLDTLFPDGAPAEQFRREKAKEQADAAQQQRELMAQHFDRSDLGGAVGAFLQARVKGNPLGLAKFFYAKDDKDGELAKANANRIAAYLRFQDAVQKIPGWDKASFNIYFDRETDAPEWFGDIQMHGNTAVGKSEGNTEMRFIKIDGIWKEDISSPDPAGPQAIAMELDNAKLEQITCNILSGKYTTVEEVQSAITAAHFPSPHDREMLRLYESRLQKQANK